VFICTTSAEVIQSLTNAKLWMALKLY